MSKYYRESGVHKLMTITVGGMHYWVQEMPACYGCGRDYAVMKERRQLHYTRFPTANAAAFWLMGYLKGELDAATLFPREVCQI